MLFPPSAPPFIHSLNILSLLHTHTHYITVTISFNIMMNNFATFILLFFLATSSLSFATRPDPSTTQPNPTSTKDKTNKGGSNGGGNSGGGGYNAGGPGGFFGPGGGFDIPGLPPNFGSGIVGGGYGGGYGGPNGGSSGGGIVRATTVCKDAGPCYKKKLTCPAKCYTSYSRSGKGFGGGGGGGGCTLDCKKCVAYC